VCIILDESRRLQELQELINYKFNDESLLKKALIHRSFGNENWEYKNINNEKLELLGRCCFRSYSYRISLQEF